MRRLINFCLVRAIPVSEHAHRTSSCGLTGVECTCFSQKGVLLLVAVWGSSGCYNSRRTDVAHLQSMRGWRVRGGGDNG